MVDCVDYRGSDAGETDLPDPARAQFVEFLVGMIEEELILLRLAAKRLARPLGGEGGLVEHMAGELPLPFAELRALPETRVAVVTQRPGAAADDCERNRDSGMGLDES